MNSTAPSGLSARRKDGKGLPKLDRAVFAKAAESAASMPDPSSVFPSSVLDANVALQVDEWENQAGDLLKVPISGVVISLRDGNELSEQRLKEVLEQPTQRSIVAVVAPTHHSDQGLSKIPPHITNSPVPIAFSMSFKKGSTTAQDIKMILSAGHVVDLDVPWDKSQAEAELEWDSLQEVVAGAMGAEEADKAKAIVISNLLPPPHSLLISIVSLMSHPNYQAYQSGLSQLAFVSNVYLKLLPPSWDDPTPQTPNPVVSQRQGAPATNQAAKDEWKRRVKMYLGPALDAFGYSRLIFGTSPSPSSSSFSTAHDWYALVREVVAELGVEQEGMDAIFGGNAKAVYSR